MDDLVGKTHRLSGNGFHRLVESLRPVGQITDCLLNI